jgi:trimethylamine corrinoid protein
MDPNDKLEEIRLISSKNHLEQLKKAIATYDKELAKESIEGIVNKKIDPLTALDVITNVLRLIGEAFEKEDLFLPDLVAAGDTMMAIVPQLEEELKKTGQERKILGTVVLGTVKGDIHSIGKTMVGTLLTASGFKVHDLGIDVSSATFINAIKRHQPDILAMSALLTTTAYEQKNVMISLEKEGLRKSVKVMVGGSAVTQEFADSIGADAYEADAPGAVRIAKKLVGK